MNVMSTQSVSVVQCPEFAVNIKYSLYQNITEISLDLYTEMQY